MTDIDVSTDIDFDSTPDKVTPLGTGDRIMTIKEITDEETADKKQFIQVILQVDEPDSPENGRKMYDAFFKDEKGKLYEQAAVKYKHLIRSAGFTSGVGRDELIEKTVKARVVSNTYVDKSTKETVENSKIKDYVYDAS